MTTKEDLWPSIKAHYDKVYPKEPRAPEVHTVPGPPLTFATTAPSTTTPIGFGAPWYGATIERNFPGNFAQEIREHMLVLYFGWVYITSQHPNDFMNAKPEDLVSLVEYSGKSAIDVSAISYFSHARVICSIGQVIDSIAESYIDKN